MAAVELDPLFMRALALLRSKSKDSTDMLKAMLDEVIGKPTGKFSDKPASPSVGSGKTERSEAESKKTAVKRTAEKSAFGDALSAADTSVLSKKPKIEPDVRPSRIQPRKPVVDDDDDDDDDDHQEDDDEDTEEEGGEEKEEKGSQSSGEDDSLPGFDKEDEKLGSAGDDDEMWLGLACVVCKELGISAGNTLIECQECHNLYHQKCHTPPVTDTDPNDPRLVWYCAKCKRSIKKAVPKKPSSLPESIITTAISSSSSSSSSSSGKDVEKGPDSSLNLFRRADPKPSPTSTTSKQQPFGGLASYAANLTNRQHSSSSKPAQTGSSRIITSGSSSKQGSISSSSSSLKPGAITSRSSSISGTSSNRLASIKTQGIQRSSSQSSSKSSSSSTPVVSSAAAKAITSGLSSMSSSSSKAMPQTSTESAMKRLQMMKKKASKR